MIEQAAIIIEASSSHLLLKPVSGGCHSCGQNGCGVSNLSAIFGKRERLLRTSNPGGFKQGQQVEVLIPEGSFIRLVTAQYLLPLLFMMIGAAFGASVSALLPVQVVFAATGLIVGVILSRQYIARTSSILDMHSIKIRPFGQTNTYPVLSVQVKP